MRVFRGVNFGERASQMLAHQYVPRSIEVRRRRQDGEGAHYEYAGDEPGRKNLYGLNHAHHRGFCGSRKSRNV